MVELTSLPAPATPQRDGIAATITETSASRHDGWTRPKIMRFLELLAESGSVTAAAQAVGMSRGGAYRLRTRLIGQPFDLAWEAALEFGINNVAHEALDRALNGTLVPVYHRGELIGERRVFNERAVQNLMMTAPQLGRHHHARDWATKNWTDLMGRISDGPLVWTEEEQALSDDKHPLHAYYTREMEAEDGEQPEDEVDLSNLEYDMKYRDNPTAQNYIEKQSRYGPAGPHSAAVPSGPRQRANIPRIRQL